MATLTSTFTRSNIHLPSPSRKPYSWEQDISLQSLSSNHIRHDVEYLTRLNHFISECENWTKQLYVYRPCARALPPGSDEIIVEILEPFAGQMSEFQAWIEDVISAVLDALKGLRTEELRLTILHLLGLLFELDAVKNVKSSLKNDFSIFKRYKGGMEDDMSLVFFLAQSNSTMAKLKEAVLRAGLGDWMLDLLVLACERLEKNLWCWPSQRFLLYKAMVMSSGTLDKKKLRPCVDRVTKLFKECPYLPIYGDIAADLHQFWEFPVNVMVFDAPTAFLEINERLRVVKEDNAVKVFTDAVQILSKWTSKVYEFYAFKIRNPHFQAKDSPYVQAVKANLTPQEKDILHIYVKQIVALSTTILNLAQGYQDTFVKHTAKEYEKFHVHQLKPAFNTSSNNKRKKGGEANILIEQAYAVLEAITLDPPGRPSPNLTLLRMLLSASTGEGSKKRLLSRESVTQFLEKSFWFPLYHDYLYVIGKCSDLGGLWFKEYFLDLSKVLQVPVDTSVPFILLTHSLAPLKIYDDAARTALTFFKQKFVFNEIEAEANLAFDQFVFGFAQKNFLSARFAALGKTDHSQLEKTPLTLSLLGRTIPFRKITTQIYQHYLASSVNVAIARFESAPFPAISELADLLAHHRAVARILNQPFALTSRQKSRIADHALEEFITDVCRNWCWNASTMRFVKSCVVYTTVRPAQKKVSSLYLYGSKQVTNDSLAKSALQRMYIGLEHIRMLCDLVDIQPIVDSLGHLALSTINEKFMPALEELQAMFPSQMRLPSIELGTIGSFEYYLASLKEIVKNTDKDKLFGIAQEVGNVIVLLSLINHCMRNDAITESTRSFFDARDRLEKVPRGLDKIAQTARNFLVEDLVNWADDETRDIFMKACDPLFATSYTSANVIDLLGTFRRLFCENLIPATRSDDWETSKDLYRVWSSVMLLFQILPYSVQHGFSARLLFGDAVVIVGTLLLVATKQEEAYSAFDISRSLLHVHQIENSDRTSWFKSAKKSKPEWGMYRVDLDSLEYVEELEQSWFLAWKQGG